MTPRRWQTREALLGVAVALIGIPFGLLLHEVTTDGPLTSLDDRVARWLHARIVDDGWQETVLRAISYTGKPLFLFVLVGLPVIWLWRRRANRLAWFLAVVSLGGSQINLAIKAAVGRPRPVLDEPIATAFGKSFPSGHSMSSLVCYGALAVVFLPWVAPRWRRPVVVATALWVAAIGFSRMALGVHFLSDVLGGYVLGTAWLVGSIALFETWRVERGRRPTDVLEEGLEPEAPETVSDQRGRDDGLRSAP
jgi:undecaprenyl-diphosphatase